MTRPAVATFGATGRIDPVVAPHLAFAVDVPLKASTTFVKGTVIGEKTSDGKYAAYASGASDGTQIPKGIVAYNCTTDASGNITIEGEFGQTRKLCPMWIAGVFNTAELTGLDANAVTVLAANLIQGDTTTGQIRL